VNFVRLIPESVKDLVKQRLRVPESHLRLRNLKRAGFIPSKAIDCGAYRGDWSRSLKRIFPEIEILMIEPQEEMGALLDPLAQENPSWAYEQVALGARSEKKHFLSQRSNSRVVKEEDLHLFNSEDIQIVQTSALDDLVQASSSMINADYLKIDSQGYEIEILNGARRVLETVQVVQLEVSIIQIGPCPSSLEVMDFMAERNFVLYDIFDFNYRPLDKALWQVDCLFVRQDSPLLQSKEWE
jgi:FkbM family methyltransferase